MGLGTAHYTTTTHTRWIPSPVWSKETKRYREANLVFGKLVKRLDNVVGASIRVPHSSTEAARAKSALTEVTYDATTESYTDIDINRQYYKAKMLEDIVKEQSIINAEDEIRKEIGYALAKEMDAYLASLVRSGLTQSVGDAGAQPGNEDVLRAVQYLDDADSPAENRYGVVKPSVWAALLKIDEFTQAQILAISKTESPILTYTLPDIYGIQWAKSTNVDVSANVAYNAIFHKDCMVLVTQQGIKIASRYEPGFIGTQYVGSQIYGAGVLRADHGVQLLAKVGD